ncbi:MAG: NAD-dependent epimerase/dehydratase family protein [Pyrinomonadaceae bacterium]
MQQILVTGGAGFIGSHLVDRLLAERQWDVTVIDDFNDFYAPGSNAIMCGHIWGAIAFG